MHVVQGSIMLISLNGGCFHLIIMYIGEGGNSIYISCSSVMLIKC